VLNTQDNIPRNGKSVGLKLNQKSHATDSKSTPGLSDTKLLVVVSIVVTVFLVEQNVGIVADFIPDLLVTPEAIALFIGAGVTFAVGGYLILSHVKQKQRQGSVSAQSLKISHGGVSIAQYVLVAIIAIVILQVLLTSQYNLATLYASLSISYGLWIVTLALLAKKLFSWYRSASRNKMVLILALSMIAYVVNGVFILASNLGNLQEQPEVVPSDYVAYFPAFDPETWQGQIYTVLNISSAAGYVLTWISTVLLLKPYIRKIGKGKFYAIMGAAMVYYLITFPLFVLGYFTPTEETDADVMNNILIFGVANVFSGIVFAAAFLSVARTLQKGSALRDYMKIAAYGMLLFYVAGSAIASQAAYPPFGLASVAFTGLACYLVYSGFYSSATIMSQDLALRSSIKKSVMEQSKLLDSIGTAEMSRELQVGVLEASKKASKTLEEEQGVSPSMTDSDITEYMQTLLQEIQKSK